VLPKVGEIMGKVVGVDGPEERIVCLRVGAESPLERLITLFHVLGCELEVLARHVAGRTRSAVAVNVGEAQREENRSYRCVTAIIMGRHVLRDTARRRCQNSAAICRQMLVLFFILDLFSRWNNAGAF
jgi:hypothetical protein